jgi:hypothetical protein
MIKEVGTAPKPFLSVVPLVASLDSLRND